MRKETIRKSLIGFINGENDKNTEILLGTMDSIVEHGSVDVADIKKIWDNSDSEPIMHVLPVIYAIRKLRYSKRKEVIQKLIKDEQQLRSCLVYSEIVIGLVKDKSEKRSVKKALRRAGLTEEDLEDDRYNTIKSVIHGLTSNSINNSNEVIRLTNGLTRKTNNNIDSETSDSVNRFSKKSGWVYTL